MTLPLPPLQMRQLVGPTDPTAFDQPVGQPVFATATNDQYDSVFDFGCGCGRIARKLALGAPRPKRYVGVDLHRGMVQWCNDNLATVLPGFEFHHLNVHNAAFNPDPSRPLVAPFPVDDQSVTLFIAWSVFTHIVESQVDHYLDELKRVLRPDGIAMITTFLFDKAAFPMMQDFQNALYINDVDPWNAVIFDTAWLIASLERRGLRIRAADAPEVYGFQWTLEVEVGIGSISLPEDLAPVGRRAPPLVPAGAPAIGLADA